MKVNEIHVDKLKAVEVSLKRLDDVLETKLVIKTEIRNRTPSTQGLAKSNGYDEKITEFEKNTWYYEFIEKP